MTLKQLPYLVNDLFISKHFGQEESDFFPWVDHPSRPKAIARMKGRDRESASNKDNDYISTSSVLLKKALSSLVKSKNEPNQENSLTRIQKGLSQGFHMAWESANLVRKSLPHGDLFLTALATALIILGLRGGTRRFRTATEIPLCHYREGRILKGLAIAVNDSDNLRFYHRPHLSLPFTPKIAKQDLKYETINVRLAGIDAPEMAHFGGEAQPYAREAKEWLCNFVQGSPVTIKLHRLDQYTRAVATVYVRRLWFFQRNVSLAMVEAGYATVYQSTGAEYGGIKEKLMAAEARARYAHMARLIGKLFRRAKKGMWQQSMKDYISPADHKRTLKLSQVDGNGPKNNP